MAGAAAKRVMFLPAAAGMMLAVLAGSQAGADAAGQGEGPVAVTDVLAGNLVRLADGHTVRLAGIRVPADDGGHAGAERLAEQARAELSSLLDGQMIRLAPAETAHDRYGRLVAQIERSDGLWLQGALLERGLAQVQTRPGEVARTPEMLVRERTARAARRGLWAEPAFMPQDASAMGDDSTGRFRIVQGRVLRVAPTDRHVYLNFGGDWRSDFTVRLRRADLRSALAGLELEGLAGRRIEVRGVILQAGGPLIELSHLEQMQILQ